jgi:hypothetical protein
MESATSQYNSEQLVFTEFQFKVLILCSLPPSWDGFVEPYFARPEGSIDNEARKTHQLIGALRQEYLWRLEAQQHKGAHRGSLNV